MEMEEYTVQMDRYTMVKDSGGCPACAFYATCGARDPKSGEINGYRCWDGHVWRKFLFFQPIINNK